MSEMSEYVQMFVDETGEQLDDLVDVLLVLEREPGSVEELNEAFRLVHSIKGAAGMMGLDTITTLTHHLEPPCSGRVCTRRDRNRERSCSEWADALERREGTAAFRFPGAMGL